MPKTVLTYAKFAHTLRASATVEPVNANATMASKVPHVTVKSALVAKLMKKGTKCRSLVPGMVSVLILGGCRVNL